MRLLSALHLHHPPMFRYLLRKMYFAKVFLEWDISNQNYLFGSGQKGSKCSNAASRDKNTSRFYQKRHILLWQVVLLLAYFGTRILLSLFDTQPIQKVSSLLNLKFQSNQKIDKPFLTKNGVCKSCSLDIKFYEACPSPIIPGYVAS